MDHLRFFDFKQAESKENRWIDAPIVGDLYEDINRNTKIRIENNFLNDSTNFNQTIVEDNFEGKIIKPIQNSVKTIEFSKEFGNQKEKEKLKPKVMKSFHKK